MLYSETVLKWQNNFFSCQNNNCKANNQAVACSLVVQASIKKSKLCQKSAINKADFASSLGNTKATLSFENPNWKISPAVWNSA